MKQAGVAAGMAAGLVVSIAVVVFGSRLFDHVDSAERIALSFLLPATALFIAIARLAKHRFFTPEDIDGSALSVGTERARLLQALLQNTLEQLTLAVAVYLSALLGAAGSIQATVLACACTFLVGRLLFFATYKHGAAARAAGFALTFYPTVLLMFWQAWLLLRFIAA